MKPSILHQIKMRDYDHKDKPLWPHNQALTSVIVSWCLLLHETSLVHNVFYLGHRLEQFSQFRVLSVSSHLRDANSDDLKSAIRPEQMIDDAFLNINQSSSSLNRMPFPQQGHQKVCLQPMSLIDILNFSLLNILSAG